MKITKNVNLSDFSTFKIGGKAKYFCKAQTPEDLKEAVVYAKEKELPFFVLGGGSNVVIPDEGLRGLVIKVELKGFKFEEREKGTVRVEAAAGESWDGLVQKSVSKNLYGLENLSGIPGTVGGAPVQNIGAYGVELKDVLHSVKVLDISDLQEKELKPEECFFGYRDSIFKKPIGQDLIITSVVFELKKKGRLNTDYPDIKKEIAKKKIKDLDPKKLRRVVLSIRKRKFPVLKNMGTAGSFFKNPIIGQNRKKVLEKRFPEMPIFPAGEGQYKVSLAWILDNVCGMKGYKLENIEVHDKQPLVLVNLGKGTAEELKNMSDKISQKVFRETGIKIENEVTFL